VAEGNDQEKTEPATDKKRSDARAKGQVAKSQEISSVAILLGSLAVFMFGGSWVFLNLKEFMGYSFQNIGTTRLNDVVSVRNLIATAFKSAILTLSPLMFTVLVVGVAANIAQVGFQFSSKSLTPDISRLNPLNGIKKLFSLRSLVEVFKSQVKIIFVGVIAFVILWKEVENIPGLIQAEDVMQILLFIGRVAFNIAFFVCLALIILAVLDFAYQRWQHEKDLKMTKQEVKDETKQTEGDPQVKRRIRSVQKEMAMRRMMEAVPKADVVITNPTHLAIALKFDSGEMAAPRVEAKGAGLIAERIREIATEHNIPIVEQKPLARTLFKSVEIGEFIPVDLYRAVAEVLAYVYRLKGMNGRG
jgi:flagellar biosynthesis protein FlhB